MKFQECSLHDFTKLKRELDYKNVLHCLETGIMTNLDMKELDYNHSEQIHKNVLGRNARFVTGKIIVDPALPPVFVTCCHLHYKAEPIRLKEMERIGSYLKKLFEDNVCQVWTGDFNSLTQDDYDAEKWEDIAAVRSVSIV